MDRDLSRPMARETTWRKGSQGARLRFLSSDKLMEEDFERSR